jgi:hypothetical protein
MQSPESIVITLLYCIVITLLVRSIFMRHTSKLINDCVAKVDRVVLRSQSSLENLLQALPEFRTVSDCARLNVNSGFFMAPYGRVRQMINDRTKTKLFIQYFPRFRRLAPLRVAIVPDDRRGLKRREVETITFPLKPFDFLIIEVALDFGRDQK